MPKFDIRNTTYRYYKKEDLEDISKIEQLSINPPWSFKALCEFSECSTSKILVASYDKCVFGYITYSVVLDEIQIANVAVHPDNRRCGIAKNLLKSLYANSKTNGISVITLEVRESNLPAINLYTQLGYREVGRCKNYYKSPTEDAILMNLYL